ncbi:hypothetical protein LX64_02876 [Chitinophaga skermanii]|uniref:Pirin family protein n=1 Tax=Chitinophaga skermanii TaxID=331697 RepID=A0A327QHI4_9BACT|nr:pirin family protein [Chitinophaga skermanii]RAJ03999.1 hypothetical protein LX64_02876 [Chitinophaga skermanii]
MANTKHIQHIYEGAKPHMVGDGFRVSNLFPSGNRIGAQMNPFFLLDYAAPAYFPPTTRPRGVEEHPHRGFETVTIAYEGALEHRDSAGNKGKLLPGDVQWMTAASGILHEEKHETEFSKRGGKMEMAQLWVNLPAAAKSAAPGYQNLTKETIPVQQIDDNGSYIRVIAGEQNGVKGAAKTFTPIHVYDLQLKAGSEVNISLPEHFNTGLVVLKGAVNFNHTHDAKGTQIAVFEKEGENIFIKAKEDASILVLSGEPINEPVVAYGPFVMNTEEEIVQAINDFNEGKMGVLA